MIVTNTVAVVLLVVILAVIIFVIISIPLLFVRPHHIIVITAFSRLVFQNHNCLKSLMGKGRLATELSKRCLKGRLLERTVHYG